MKRNRPARWIVTTLSLLLVVLGLAVPTRALAQTSGPGEDVEGTTPRFVPEKPERTEILEGYSRSEAHLKFEEGTRIRLRDGRFVTLDNDDLTGLQQVLETYPDIGPSRLFSARSEEELAEEKARLERLSGREQADKNLYFSLFFPDTMAADVEAALDALNALEIVEIAYPLPLPAPDPTMHTPDFHPQQGYRESAPDGVHADAANTIPGGRGENVQIIDIERFFVPTHEDLPPVTVYPNGDPSVYTQPFDHGTAVLAQMVGVDNGFGVLGIADQAAAGFVSRAGGDANAIDVATANSSAAT